MEEARAIESSIVLMRSKMATLYDYAGMPIPVVYKIAVHLSMHVWLITFTLEKAILSEGFQYASRPVFSAICFLGVIMVVFVVVSLFAFSFLVNEPYGDDIFDLPVFSFVNMIAGTTMTIAKDKSKERSKSSYWRCNGVVADVFKYCTWWCASQPVQARQACQSSGSPAVCN